MSSDWELRLSRNTTRAKISGSPSESGALAHVGAGESEPDVLAEQGRQAAATRTSARAPAVEPEPVPVAALERAAAPLRTSVSNEHLPASATEARAWIASGDAARALGEAERAIRRRDVDPWRMVQGDALRALGRMREAADAYHRAAEELGAPRRQQAGFLEARLRASELGDADGALRALRDAGVAADGSPLRERGLALQAQLLARLGRTAELEVVAERYLSDYPDGPQAETMQSLRQTPPR